MGRSLVLGDRHGEDDYLMAIRARTAATAAYGVTEMTLFQFGEDVEGYDIRVLNEREIRAAAGLLFLMMFVAIGAVTTGNWALLKYSVVVFFVDISMRLFLSPRLAPTLIIGRWIVRRQTPEYVGAEQKRFAWLIGFALAAFMMIALVGLNLHSPFSAIICLICLAFLFSEAAFGICWGCKVYSLIYRKKAQHCPGEVCEVKDRRPIQKIAKVQLAIVVAFAAFVALLAPAIADHVSRKPEFVLGAQDPQRPVVTPPSTSVGGLR